MIHHKNLKIKSLNFIFFYIIFVFSIKITNAQNQLVVKPINAVTNPLIDSLVGNLVGDGVKVLNIKSNLKPTSKALGTFKGPEQLLGIKEGLMMVTGDVSAMVGANTGALIVSNPILPADTLPGCSSGRQFLNKVLNYDVPVGTSRRATDCATIQFDIIPYADSIKFNYVFASEEYNTFVCSNFNDIFGFFINGPGIVGDQSLAPTYTMTKNLAIIPNSDLPVSINTVNNGEPGSAGVASNCTFTSEGTAAYLDNTDISFNPFIFNRFKFNGLTTVLTAAVKVVPCQTYTLTLTVSDVNDGSYDSGVFIEKGSLRSGLTTSASSVYSARFPYSIINCNPGTFIVKRDGSNAGERVLARYTIGGTAINGVDYVQRLRNGNTQPLIDSIVLEPGVAADTITIVGLDGPTWSTTEQKYIVLKFLNSNLPYFNGAPNYCGDSSFMYIRKKFLYNAGPDKKICQLQDTLLKPVSIQVGSDIYRWRELNANGDTIVSQYLSCNTCPIPRAFNPSTTSFVVYVFDSLSGCVSNDTVVVSVENAPTSQFSSTAENFSVCKGNPLVISANPTTANTSWTYLWFGMDPLNIVESSSINKKDLQIISHNQGQFYKVRIKNILGCTKEDSVFVSIKQLYIGADTVICQDSSLTINAGLGFGVYSWSNGTNGSSITINQSGTYFVSVLASGGCSFTDSIVVTVSPCTSVESSILSKTSMVVYPNPSKGKFIFNFSGLKDREARLKVYTLTGKEIYKESFYTNRDLFSKPVDIGQVANGLYIVEVETRSGVYRDKIIIQ
jgi:hypothetical protein